MTISPLRFSRFLVNLSILANLNNTVVWRVSIIPLISNSSRPFSKTLRTVSSVPNPNDIIVTDIFSSMHGPSIYVSLCFLLFSFCGAVERQYPLDEKLFFLVNQYDFWSSCRDYVIGQCLKILEKFLHLGRILVCLDTIWYYY